jgi:hypothetical protein
MQAEPKPEPVTNEEYRRMAETLEEVAARIRQQPELNHHFAERLTLMAKQMREDARQRRAKSLE